MITWSGPSVDRRTGYYQVWWLDPNDVGYVPIDRAWRMTQIEAIAAAAHYQREFSIETCIVHVTPDGEAIPYYPSTWRRINSGPWVEKLKDAACGLILLAAILVLIFLPE